MIISIYHKDRWTFLACKDGSRHCPKERAYNFTQKEGEAMVELMKSLGFLVQTQ